jgi:hypothetical protein
MFRRDRDRPLPAITLPNPEGFPMGGPMTACPVPFTPKPNSLSKHPDPYDPADFATDRLCAEDERPPVVLQADPIVGMGFDATKALVLVPVASHVQLDCDHSLRALESLGIRVDRQKGSSAIDATRCVQATRALDEGFEQILFIDSDMVFDPADAVKFFRSPEPVIGAVYAAKKLGKGQINVDYDPSVDGVVYGDLKDGAIHRLYPVNGIGAGFLRIRTSVLKRMAEELMMPRCQIGPNAGYPFFMPQVRPMPGEELPRYLCEDYAFCHRCRDIGVIPKADTTVRVYHIGDYPYGWEEARGDYIPRERSMEAPARKAVPTKTQSH